MSERYAVFEVGCMECIGNGTAEPELILKSDDLIAAHASAAVADKYGDADRFVFDTETMSIIGVSSSESDTDTR
jgi:hypothetical protein